MDGTGGGRPRLPFPHAGHGNPERRASSRSESRRRRCSSTRAARPTSSAPGSIPSPPRTLPVLTNLMNWDKMFQSPFKSDVYFFSTRQQIEPALGHRATRHDPRQGLRRGARARLRRLLLAHRESEAFQTKVSGTREVYRVGELEPQLRQTHRRPDVATPSPKARFRSSTWPPTWLKSATGSRRTSAPVFAEMGIALDQFVVENLSLPEELQKFLDTRIGMNMIGNMQQYTQFQAANRCRSPPPTKAAASPAWASDWAPGSDSARSLANALNPNAQPQQPPQAPPPAAPPAGACGWLPRGLSQPPHRPAKPSSA